MSGYNKTRGPDMADFADAEYVEIVVGHANQVWVNVGGACFLRVGRAANIIFDINEESPYMQARRQEQLESQSVQEFEPIEDYTPDTDAGHFTDPNLDP